MYEAALCWRRPRINAAIAFLRAEGEACWLHFIADFNAEGAIKVGGDFIYQIEYLQSDIRPADISLTISISAWHLLKHIYKYIP